MPNDDIGAVKVDIGGDFSVVDTLRLFVKPMDRFNQQIELDPFLSKLTGISQNDINASGLDLSAALEKLDQFSQGQSF